MKVILLFILFVKKIFGKIIKTYQIAFNLMTSNKIKIKLNVNIHNIYSKLPIHLLLEKENIPENNNIMELLLKSSNLNFQDNEGNTPFHFICKKDIWKNYKNISNSF